MPGPAPSTAPALTRPSLHSQFETVPGQVRSASTEMFSWSWSPTSQGRGTGTAFARASEHIPPSAAVPVCARCTVDCQVPGWAHIPCHMLIGPGRGGACARHWAPFRRLGRRAARRASDSGRIHKTNSNSGFEFEFANLDYTRGLTGGPPNSANAGQIPISNSNSNSGVWPDSRAARGHRVWTATLPQPDLPPTFIALQFCSGAAA